MKNAGMAPAAKNEAAIVYWDCRQSEQLQNEDMDDEIEQWLDDAWDPAFETMTRDQVLAALPETIELVGYKRRYPSTDEYTELVLDPLLESIDEEYGDPDDYTEPTDEMKKLERAFIAGILSLYTSWSCEEAVRRTVVVADWIAAHAPEWLPSGGKAGGQ